MTPTILLLVTSAMLMIRSSACSIRQATPTTTGTTLIQLRLATRTDVPAIQRCNLACLPENYNSHFYCSHLRQWSDLALVAEDISHVHANEITEQRPRQSRNPFGFSGERQNEPKIVAYVLGKVNTRPSIDYNDRTLSRGNRIERLGHVTSLAVHKEFRRLGLAKSLMDQLHYHLQHHRISSCGLHVRTSNLAACCLYQDDGYQIDEIIKGYYQDGEDAYFMRRIFSSETTTNFEYDERYETNQFAKKPPWLSGPEALRLPRYHNYCSPYQDDLSNQQLFKIQPTNNEKVHDLTLKN